MLFTDRKHAGRELALRLMAYKQHPRALVLGLPRGGVPVAHEVAKALSVPLDVCVVRKLGVPGHEEVAMAAIAPGGVCVCNDDLVQACHISQQVIDSVAAQETKELTRQELLYRGVASFPEIQGKVVIVVDDGIATGATIRAAMKALRVLEPARVIAAAPVGSVDTCDALAQDADEVICPHQPEPFHAVGFWYQDFTPTTDEQVGALLSPLHQKGPQP